MNRMQTSQSRPSITGNLITWTIMRFMIFYALETTAATATRTLKAIDE